MLAFPRIALGWMVLLLALAQVAAVSYPGTEWDSVRPEDAGMSGEKLALALDYAFPAVVAPVPGPGIRTDGVVVIRGGRLVAERYRAPYSAGKRHMAWSMSKSFLSVLLGAAALDGKLAVTDPAARYYPGLATDDLHAKITIDDLLHMSSGLDWREAYESSPLDSTVVAMLYAAGRRDMPGYAARFPVRHRPGTHWSYSSGDSNILSAVLRWAIGDSAYATYPWTKLFDRIGMESAVWERDGNGHFVGSSYAYATPRDMARFGYLCLQDGVWNGDRLVPEGWMAHALELAPAIAESLKGAEPEKQRYGAHFWLNAGGPTPYWAEAPADTFAAMGHWGQAVYVIPSLDLVVVRTADDRDESFSTSTFLKLVAEAVTP